MSTTTKSPAPTSEKTREIREKHKEYMLPGDDPVLRRSRSS